jgi:hypothetical protein
MVSEMVAAERAVFAGPADFIVRSSQSSARIRLTAAFRHAYKLLPPKNGADLKSSKRKLFF